MAPGLIRIDEGVSEAHGMGLRYKGHKPGPRSHKTNSQMATVKLGLTGLPATGFVAKAQGVHDGMNGNANFPSPEPTLPVFQGYIDALVAANAAVEANGGKAEHTARRVAVANLRAAYKQLAAYVQMASGGDAVKIMSANFQVVKRGTPVGELPPPKNLGARLTNFSGRVDLRWKREDGADMHHVYMSTSDSPFKWELIGVTSKSRFHADSLEPGKFYWFAVSAIGAAGESSKSEPCLAMAAA